MEAGNEDDRIARETRRQLDGSATNQAIHSAAVQLCARIHNGDVPLSSVLNLFPASEPKGCAEHLDRVQAAVIQALFEARPNLMVYPDLAERAGYSVREVGDAVRALEVRKLVHRPEGPRSGATLTQGGIETAKRLLGPRG